MQFKSANHQQSRLLHEFNQHTIIEQYTQKTEHKTQYNYNLQYQQNAKQHTNKTMDWFIISALQCKPGQTWLDLDYLLAAGCRSSEWVGAVKSAEEQERFDGRLLVCTKQDHLTELGLSFLFCLKFEMG